MSAPISVPLPDGDVRIFEPDPEQDDLGRMYVLDVFGMSVLIRERAGDFYVHVDKDGTSTPVTAIDTKSIAVEVNNAGEVIYE